MVSFQDKKAGNYLLFYFISHYLDLPMLKLHFTLADILVIHYI